MTQPRDASSPARRPWPVRLLAALLALQGVSALGGGAVMVADPSGRMLGWDTHMLAATPFTTYLGPGLVLGVGLGVSALLIAYGVLARPAWPFVVRFEDRTGHHWAWSASIGLGIGVMAWIVVQVALIGLITALQPLVFVVGGALTGVPLLPSVRQHLAVSTPTPSGPASRDHRPATGTGG